MALRAAAPVRRPARNLFAAASFLLRAHRGHPRQGAEMGHAYVIEVAGEPAGIVARDGRGFRFHAASHAFRSLEGRAFRRPSDAERAARELARKPAHSG